MENGDKTCLEGFQKILYITGKISEIVGCDSTRPGYKMNALTWLVIVAINVYFLCTLYTIYIGFIINGDWKLALQALSLSGSAIQGYIKLITAIRHTLILVSMKEKLINIYREYQDDEDFRTVLRFRTTLTTNILKAVVCLYVILGSTMIMYPIVSNLLNEEKLLIMSFYLPGINPATNVGHIIHNVVHGILIVLGCFGNFAGDIYVFILITHIPLFKDIIKIKCKKLNRVIVAGNEPEKTMPMLKDVVNWHQNYNIFSQEAEFIYYGVILVQILTSVFGISCTLFCIIIKSWPAAFAYLIYSLSMMYIFCGLGHLVNVSNDEVTDIIYCDCLWYELTVPQQKLVLLMLRKSQVPTNLTVGPIMPLSMSTALQLTKAIYSYMMMLVNFLD